MSAIDEQIELASKILKGEMRHTEVKKELDRILAEYGEDCFNSYTVKRMPKPWTEKTIEDLKVLSASGASSREFYEYMSEVCDEVHSKKISKKKKYIVAGLAIVIVLGVVLSICYGHSKKKAEITKLDAGELLLDDNQKAVCAVIFFEIND